MTLQLTRLKCYGWHNLLDQDIELHEGDVFSIGASETGKTTLLDSMQLLLTGDMDTQWNTAANPTLSRSALKEHGRKLHDILIRRQDDGSILRPDGMSIGYFAIELVDDETRQKTTLAFGGRTLGHQSGHVEKWWMLAPGTPLASVKFMGGQNGQGHLLDKEDFKAENNADCIFDTARYRARLAKFLFPHVKDHPEQLHDYLKRWTAFLNVGKSYGRLKEQNVDDLMRQALPEPLLEAFEEAKKGLGEVRSIRLKLDEARKQLETLQVIQGDLVSARQHNLQLRVIEYCRKNLVHAGIKADQASLAKRSATQAEHAQQALLQVIKLDAEISGIDKRLQAINDPTKVALVSHYETAKERHAEAATRATELEGKHRLLQAELQRLDAEIEALEKSIKETQRTVRARIEVVAAHAPASLQKAILAFAGTVDQGDLEGIETTRARIMREAQEAQTAITTQLGELRRDANEWTKKAEALQAEATGLEGANTVAPLKELASAMELVGDRATPLYLGVEIKPGQEKTAILLQEFLGPRILGALVPTKPDLVMRVRNNVHGRHPGLLVVDTGDLPHATIPTGLLGCIDQEASNPGVVRFLTHAYSDVVLLEAGQDHDGQNRVVWRDGTVFDGRTWRIEQGATLRFLGQKAREAARQARLAQIAQELKSIEKEQKAIRVKQEALHVKETELHQAAADSVAAYTTSGLSQKRTHLAVRTSSRLPTQTAFESAQSDLTAAATHRDALGTQVEECRKAVKAAGADKMLLDRNNLLNKLEQARRQRDDAKAEQNKAQARSDDALAGARAKDALLSTAHAELTQARQAILTIRPMTHEEFEAEVAERAKDTDKSLEMAHARISGYLGEKREAVRKAVAQLPQSENMVFDPERLSVHATNSPMTLDDRVKQLAEHTRQEKGRQQERISTIYTEQVIGPIGPMLKGDLTKMEDLVRDINKQLKGIPFNKRTYVLQHRKAPTANEQLLRLIQDFTPQDSGPLLDFLQQKFLDEQTSVEDLQAMFDYRKWYTFTLQRTKLGSEELGDASSLSSSGGAQAAPHYILVYAMLKLLYDSAGSRIRFILLDEAFRGVDAGNKPVLYEMGKHLGLTLIVANTEFEGHSTLRSTADVLMFTKNEHSETFIQPWSQKRHAATITR